MASAFATTDGKGCELFTKEEIETLFDELRRNWARTPDWEKLNRDAHLGIARSDAGASLGEIDPQVVALIEKYKPKS